MITAILILAAVVCKFDSGTESQNRDNDNDRCRFPLPPAPRTSASLQWDGNLCFAEIGRRDLPPAAAESGDGKASQMRLERFLLARQQIGRICLG